MSLDTIAAWRVETERPIMDSVPDWLVVEREEVAVAREGEVEEEKEEEVTPSRMSNSKGQRQPPIFSPRCRAFFH